MRVFATPFVVTLAACYSQAPPPAPPPQQITPIAPTDEPRTWSVWHDAQGCKATLDLACQATTPCNPPPPTPYPCPDGVALDATITIVQPSVGSGCAIRRPPMNCPPHVMCNPPPPREVPCPK